MRYILKWVIENKKGDYLLFDKSWGHDLQKAWVFRCMENTIPKLLKEKGAVRAQEIRLVKDKDGVSNIVLCGRTMWPHDFF